MKKFKPFIPVIILLVSMGCEKESPGSAPAPRIVDTLPPVGNTPPPVVNTAPEVSAGANIAVLLPVDSVFLNGSAIDAENNIDSNRWRQLSGPGQAIIQTPDLFKTKISTLVKGEYSFELTVIDKGGLKGKDTANVMVFDPADVGTNQKIFRNLQSECGWGGEGGCWVSIENIFSHIPRNVPIKVFLKSMDSPAWIEIPQQNYFFSSNGEYFWIQWFSLDESKKWEVMIVY